MTSTRRFLTVLAIPALALSMGGSLAAAGTSTHAAVVRPAASSTPPSCSNTSKKTDCVHAPSQGITAEPASKVTSTFTLKYHQRILHFSGSIKPLYQTCPDGGIPDQDIPCTQRGLTVQARLYMPDGSPAPSVGGDNPGAPSTSGDCQYFECKHIKMYMPEEYYGPGTVIVNYGVGNIVDGPNGPGAFSSSDYENTFKVPADPAVHVLHSLRGHSVYTGKTTTRTIHLAGKGGVPKHGVAGVVVFLDGKAGGSIKHGNYFGNSLGALEVIKGTTLKLVKEANSHGTFTVRPMAYVSSKPELKGDLYHAAGPRTLHVAKKTALPRKLVPTDAKEGVFAVTTPHGTASIGGVKVVKLDEAEYVMAPISQGILHVHAPRGTKVTLYGYLEPVHSYDEGSTITPSYPQAFASLTNLPEYP